MASDRPSGNESRVLQFPRRGSRAPPQAPSPVADLAKFERGDDPDDYRHRMKVNAAAFVVVLLLIGAGLWLAETMAALRTHEDCVLSGRKNCTPIELHNGRW